jgi:DNA-binding NtrC family response regulator
MHLLCAHHDEGTRLLLRWYLEDAGFDVTTARDGLQVWDVLGSEGCDVLIADRPTLRMVGSVLSGGVGQVRPSLPTVMVVEGLADLAELERHRIAPTALLLRPFDAPHLVNIVQEALRKGDPHPVTPRSGDSWWNAPLGSEMERRAGVAALER